MKSKSIFEDFSERSLKTVLYAQEEAIAFDSSFVGTEHLLLGIITEGSPGAGGLLVERGLTLAKAREAVSKNMNPEFKTSGPRWLKRIVHRLHALPFSPGLIAVLKSASSSNAYMVTPELLLLDILSLKSEKVVQILQTQNISIEELEREIHSQDK